MALKNWLNKPYPFVAELRNKFLVSVSFGLFIYFFLMIFQPFGIAEIIGNKYTYLLGFGLITSLVLLFNFTALPLIIPKFFDLEKWNIGNEISFIVLNIAIIALLNYLYNSIVGYGFSEQHSIVYFVLFTVAVGLFPVVFLVFVTELLLSRKHQKTASEITSKMQFEKEDEYNDVATDIELVSESINEKFSINISDLIFIQSEDNYCKLYFRIKNEIKSELLRITLKNIEQQLEAFPFIIRTHRSYIVNKKQVSKISGNARAYALHFDNCEETVPVSRSFPKESLL